MRARTHTIVITFVLLFVFLFSPFVFAADFTSSGFMARDPGTNDFGGTSTSTNFEVIQSGGDVSTSESTSASFALDSGPLFFDSLAPKTQNWRWYDDEGSETPTSALAGENVAPTDIANESIIKLRIAVAETAGIGSENVKFRLEFSTSSDFSDNVRYVAESWECSGSVVWCYANGAGIDGDVISTKVLSDADACAGGIGDGCGTHNESGTTTSTFTHQASAVTEYEFTVEQAGATANTVYFFRLIDTTASSSVSLNTGETYPSLVSEGAALTFSIDGITALTATEGVTTDVGTTPTAVPFGTLSFSSPVEAAHRLTVTTNAEQGYKIFAYQRQGLLAGAEEIDPVLGTNASPSGWTAGCNVSAAGCYGYHSGEDVLEGGSTRFAANDTFAQFSDTPSEVAFNAAPATNKATDIVYKVEARDAQSQGAYASNIVYIVTPVF